MIDINYITNRIKTNPEPSIIQEIRDKINQATVELKFDPVPHRYTYNGKELVSVTGYIKRWEQDQDWDSILEKSALKKGVDKTTLRRQWDLAGHMATIAGTATHLYAENLCNLCITGDINVLDDIVKVQYIDGWLIPISTKQHAAAKAVEEILKDPNNHIVMTETKVFNEAYAGTFDLLVYHSDNDKSKEGLYIMDWKTNSSLINEYNRSNFKCLKSPFNYMFDESKSVYALQQSCYQIPLEDIGLKIIGRKLIHLRDIKGEPDFEIIDVPDLSRELRSVI